MSDEFRSIIDYYLFYSKSDKPCFVKSKHITTILTIAPTNEYNIDMYYYSNL